MIVRGGSPRSRTDAICQWLYGLPGTRQFNIWREVLKFRSSNGYWPKLSQPRSFNEKVCWRKLYEHESRFVQATDKIEVRKYVAGAIGEDRAKDILIPLIAVISSENELRERTFPKRGVVKPAHSSGRYILFSEESPLNLPRLYSIARIWLNHTYGIKSNEWAYTRLKRRVLVEEKIGQGTSVPRDYKFFVFHGECKLIQVDQDRLYSHTRSLYDKNWRILDVSYRKPRGDEESKPKRLDEAIELAELLAEPFKFARVDFYLSDSTIHFGEITLYPEAGLGQFYPRSFDYELGRFWQMRID